MHEVKLWTDRLCGEGESLGGKWKGGDRHGGMSGSSQPMCHDTGASHSRESVTASEVTQVTRKARAGRWAPRQRLDWALIPAPLSALSFAVSAMSWPSGPSRSQVTTK